MFCSGRRKMAVVFLKNDTIGIAQELKKSETVVQRL